MLTAHAMPWSGFLILSDERNKPGWSALVESDVAL